MATPEQEITSEEIIVDLESMLGIPANPRELPNISLPARLRSILDEIRARNQSLLEVRDTSGRTWDGEACATFWPPTYNHLDHGV